MKSFNTFFAVYISFFFHVKSCSLVLLTLLSHMILAEPAMSNPVVNIFGGETLPNRLTIHERVPEIKLENLSSYQGYYLKMFYVVGLAPLLDRPENISVREIKRVDLLKVADREYLLPPVLIAKKGISTSYNYLILVLTKTPKFLLTNPDGSLVPGQDASKDGLLDPGAIRFVFSRQQLLKPSIDAGIWDWGLPEPERFTPFVFRFP